LTVRRTATDGLAPPKLRPDVAVPAGGGKTLAHCDWPANGREAERPRPVDSGKVAWKPRRRRPKAWGCKKNATPARDCGMDAMPRKGCERRDLAAVSSLLRRATVVIAPDSLQPPGAA
jgi:hypothetical protein